MVPSSCTTEESEEILELNVPGLASAWHLMLCLKCCLRPEAVVKALLQFSQRKGLSPECILEWFSRLLSDRKDLRQDCSRHW